MIKKEVKDSIIYFWVDQEGETPNLVDRDFIAHLNEALDELIEKQEDYKGLIISSRKNNSFIAGGDLKAILDCQSEEEAYDYSVKTQECYQKIESLKIPTVAAINGDCLGAGYELTLACDYRVSKESNSIKIGLPEVKLGLLPGAGGTCRLPKLLGPKKALEILLKGKTYDSVQARAKGLVDEVVHENILIPSCVDLIKNHKEDQDKKTFFDKFERKITGENVLARNIIVETAKKSVHAETHGLYPAQEYIVKVVNEEIKSGLQRGLHEEANCFKKLVTSPQAKHMISLFLSEREIQSENKEFISENRPREVESSAVIGAGFMGRSIAYLNTHKADVRTWLKDTDEKILAEALAKMDENYAYQKEHKHLSEFEVKRQKSLLIPTVSSDQPRDCDLIIEAVSEDKKLKQKIFSELEKNNPDCILATNTSTLPLSELGAKMDYAENLVGMHYFSPVEKMPLVEVIKSEKTSDEALSTAIQFAMDQGKKVVVVNDHCGFFTSRVLAFYICEAMRCLKDGYPIEQIDETMKEVGFQVGPFELIDQVGLSVIEKVSLIIESHFGDRFYRPVELTHVLDKDWEGKASGKGFYDYSAKNGKKVNEDIYELLGLDQPSKSKESSREREIAERCLYQFCKEACECLAEGVISNPRDGDLASVYGLGFPPLLGGPFRYIDKIGLTYFAEKLDHYKNRDIPNFNLSKIIRQKIQDEDFFYEEQVLSNEIKQKPLIFIDR